MQYHQRLDDPAGRGVGGARPTTIVRFRGVRIRPLKEALEGPERRIIVRALEACSWERRRAAEALAIDRTTLFKKMRKYGLLGHPPGQRLGMAEQSLTSGDRGTGDATRLPEIGPHAVR